MTNLGETAVSFDYGEEVEWKQRNKKRMTNNLKQDSNDVSFLQVYILKGNGDVLLLLSNLYDPK